MAANRLVIIGLDGVPFRMISDFADTGLMPNTATLFNEGTLRKMQSSVPEISSVAWPSIITGENPGRHGIFGFTDLRPGSYDLRFPNFADLRAPAFWESAPGKSVILNVPSTYPVRPMNGVHISGFVSIDINRSVHPQQLIPKLRDIDYRLDVDSQLAHKDIEMFLQDLDATLAARIEAAMFLWNCIEWQTFMLTFTGTDRLMHFAFDAYEDPHHKLHDRFVEHFRKIDDCIGRLLSQMRDTDALMMLSDHGFERLQTDVYINHLLAAEGFLSFDPPDARDLAHLSPATKAFAMDPARIYVNTTDRFPAGGVRPDQKQKVLQQLSELFRTFEINHTPVIKHIYQKQHIYEGPYVDHGPDLVLVPEKGFNLKGKPAAETLTDTGPFRGKHTQHDAFLFVRNAEVNAAAEPTVTDAGRLIKEIIARR